MIEPVRNLNDLFDYSRRGLHKRWLLADKADFSKLCDFMQKIGFSIHDLNEEIPLLDDPKMKDIVYAIILVVWIQEACEKIKKLYRQDIIGGFTYQKETDFQRAKKYITAIRSFAVAHPLGTDRHPEFGFDGNYICVDIRNLKHDITAPFIKSDRICQLSFNGLQTNGKKDSDFYFYVYSDKDDGMEFFHFIGCNFEDIFQVARLYIDKLYALDKYLRKLKKNDYR